MRKLGGTCRTPADTHGLPAGIEDALNGKAPRPRRVGNVWTSSAHRGGSWLYMRLPDDTLAWSGEQTRLAAAARLQSMFAELGAGAGREFHLLALRWEDQPALPAEMTDAHRELLGPIFGSWSRLAGLCAVGVRLTPDRRTPPKRGQSFEQNREPVEQILARAGAQPLTEDEARRVEGWWTGGFGRAVNVSPLDLYPEGVALHTPVNAAALNGGVDCGMWLAGLLASGSMIAVSVRCTAVGVHGGCDDDPAGALSGGTRLQRCSIVFASRLRSGPDPFDNLYHRLGVKSLPIRAEIDAIAETAPLGIPRVGVPQIGADLDAQVLSVSGITARSVLGDRRGVWIGTAPPDYDPVWVDPVAASDRLASPMMAVVGEPGAGKTFLTQLTALQTARGGLPAVVVNPQAADSYIRFCDRVGGDLTVIATDLVGRLDPFQFAEGAVAAEILADHINGCVRLSEEDSIRLRVGLLGAARTGARCGGEALDQSEAPPRVVDLVKAAAVSDPLLALAISPEPQARWPAAVPGRVTVMEFARPLAYPHPRIPDAGVRSAAAAVRLTARAALEQVISAGGGLVAVDDADVWADASEIKWVMSRIIHSGPAHNILMLAAFRHASRLSGYQIDSCWSLGRVMAMGMTDPDEADASLALCGLDPDDTHRDFLRNAGPANDRTDPARRRAALGLYRDLDGRVGAVCVGPIPEATLLQLTNPPLVPAEGF